jgi:hypothetical protein
LSAHGAEGVTESQVLLGIPGSGPGIEAVASNEIMGPEGDEGEQRQQGGVSESAMIWRRSWDTVSSATARSAARALRFSSKAATTQSA